MDGHVVEFLAPAPFATGSILQFWVTCDNVPLEKATHAHSLLKLRQ
jgi:hypothetical protein